MVVVVTAVLTCSSYCISYSYYVKDTFLKGTTYLKQHLIWMAICSYELQIFKFFQFNFFATNFSRMAFRQRLYGKHVFVVVVVFVLGGGIFFIQRINAVPDFCLCWGKCFRYKRHWRLSQHFSICYATWIQSKIWQMIYPVMGGCSPSYGHPASA